MPFGSAFAVHNLKISMDKLPLLYLITGMATIFVGPLAGKATDTFGKMKTFVFGSMVTIITVLIYTNMGESPIWLAILIYTILFIGIFMRMIPSQALMSAVPTPSTRGSFMSVSSSLQQIAGGIAAVVAGYIVVEGSSGEIMHFDTLGYIIVGSNLICVLMMYLINKSVLKSQGLAKERLAD